MSGHIHAELMAYVYKIWFACSEKFYIGSTINFNRRRRQHIHLLTSCRHHCKALQKEFLVAGLDGIRFSIVESVDSKFIIEAEQRWIDSSNAEILLNSSRTAKNPMRDKDIVAAWKENMSYDERKRRSDLLKKTRSQNGFMESMQDGRNRYLNNGGREALSIACANNQKRIKAVERSMRERWRNKDFRSRIISSIKESLSVKIVGIDIVTGKETAFNSTAEAGAFLGCKTKSGNIRSCLIGKQKSAYGYFWRYA